MKFSRETEKKSNFSSVPSNWNSKNEAVKLG